MKKHEPRFLLTVSYSSNGTTGSFRWDLWDLRTFQFLFGRDGFNSLQEAERDAVRKVGCVPYRAE